MFSEPTVFILGDGASWHYGYPTGEDLVHQVMINAGIAEAFFRASANILLNEYPAAFIHRKTGPYVGLPRDSHARLRQEWTQAADDCKILQRRLGTVAPPVIDAFLTHNEGLHDIGKFLIAWTILRCEEIHERTGLNTNRTDEQTLLLTGQSVDPNSPGYKERSSSKREFDQADNWYRHIFHKLMPENRTSSELSQNRVHFVTFNYDVSLERYIHRALEDTSRFTTEERTDFLRQERFLHVYGAVRQPADARNSTLTSRDFEELGGATLGSGNDSSPVFYKECQERLNKIFQASQQIRTIGEHDKDDNTDIIDAARRALASAENIYILGYGFDSTNSERINIPSSLRDGSVAEASNTRSKSNVYFTNYGDHNSINKKIGQMFLTNVYSLLPPTLRVPSKRIEPPPRLYEKSTKDVYHALTQDFDW